MDFLEILGENWAELLGALGTILAVFFGSRLKPKTAEERQAAKIAKAEAAAEKKYQAAKAAALKLEEMKGEQK